MNPYERVHLWLGTTDKPEAEYADYFRIDYSTHGELDDPAYRVCGFCRDLGKRWYDEDFIGVLPRRDAPVAVDELLAETAVDREDWPAVRAACAARGIETANAAFWYADGGVVLPPGAEDRDYNGLRYIGLFAGD